MVAKKNKLAPAISTKRNKIKNELARHLLVLRTCLSCCNMLNKSVFFLNYFSQISQEIGNLIWVDFVWFLRSFYGVALASHLPQDYSCTDVVSLLRCVFISALMSHLWQDSLWRIFMCLFRCVFNGALKSHLSHCCIFFIQTLIYHFSYNFY